MEKAIEPKAEQLVYIFNGKPFTVNKTVVKQDTQIKTLYLNCCNKKSQDCPATIIIAGTAVKQGTGKNAVHSVKGCAATERKIDDLTQFMKDKCAELATTTWKTANEIWNIVDQECRVNTS
jgi:hypothetical protein